VFQQRDILQQRFTKTVWRRIRVKCLQLDLYLGMQQHVTMQLKASNTILGWLGTPVDCIEQCNPGIQLSSTNATTSRSLSQAPREDRRRLTSPFPNKLLYGIEPSMTYNKHQGLLSGATGCHDAMITHLDGCILSQQLLTGECGCSLGTLM
jgi:hypothetical protein